MRRSAPPTRVTEVRSADLNARPVFLLANQVGDQQTLIEWVEAAGEGLHSADPRVARVTLGK